MNQKFSKSFKHTIGNILLFVQVSLMLWQWWYRLTRNQLSNLHRVLLLTALLCVISKKAVFIVSATELV